MSKAITYYKVSVTANIHCLSELHVGGMEAPKEIEGERQQNLDNTTKDNRKKNGQAEYRQCTHRGDKNEDISETDFYIPANTINGFIRRLADNLLNDDEKKSLLGAEKTSTDRQGGKLSISPAYRQVSDIQPDVKKGWHDKRKTIITAHTRIDDRIGTSYHQHLYHIEQHPIGSVFQLKLEAYYLSEKELETLKKLLNLWQNNEALPIAANKSKSWGITYLSDICIKYTCIEDYISNGEETNTLKDYILNGTVIPVHDDEKTQPKEICTPKEVTQLYSLTLITKQPLLINDINQLNLISENDGTPKKHYTVNTAGKVIIPAKTLAGAFRAEARKRKATEILGNGEYSESSIDAALNEADKFIDQLFGGEQQSSCLRFRDAVLDTNDKVAHLQTQVPIDRITGAACQGQGSKSVFSVKALKTGLKFTCDIYTQRNLSNGQETLLSEVINHFSSQAGIWLGGDKARGFGLLSVQVTTGEKSNKKLLTKHTLPEKAVPEAHEDNIQHKDLKAVINPYAMVKIGDIKTSDERKYPTGGYPTGNIRHDINLPDCYSGVLTCRLTTMTDVFVGAGVDESVITTDTEAKVYRHYHRNGKLAFPASSLRGMIGSVMETISQSRLRVVEDNTYSQRKSARQAMHNLGRYVIENGKPYIKPLELLRTDKVDKTLYSNNEEVFFEIIPNTRNKIKIYKKGAKTHCTDTGRLRLMNLHGNERKNKRCDIVIQEKHAQKIPIVPKAIKNFNALLKEANDKLKKEKKEVARPYDYPCKLEEGQIVYYFSPRNANKVTEISYSAIWRKLYDVPNTYKGLDDDCLPWGTDKSQQLLTPAEALLGIIEEGQDGDQRNLASRLRFTDATSESTLNQRTDPQNGWITLKALSTPKLPSPELYFSSDNKLNGRKHYLRQQNGKIGDHPIYETQYGDNAQLKVRCKPIIANQSTTFDIHFHNLNEDELRLLAYSINPDENFHHKLGLGKPLGLGSVKLDMLAVTPLHDEQANRLKDILSDRQKGDYVDDEAFERLLKIGEPIPLSRGMLNYPMTIGQLNNYKSGTLEAAEEKLYEWHTENTTNQELSDKELFIPPQ